jgi:hypothetical protein
MDSFTLKTSQRNQFVDVTEPVRQSLRRAGIRDGLGVVYCPHTTAAITINEHADPDVAHDILLWLGRMVPQQQDGVDLLPGAVGLPVAQPAPTGHARATVHVLGQILPGQAGLEDEEDAGQGLPGADRRPPPPWGWVGTAAAGSAPGAPTTRPAVIWPQRFLHQGDRHRRNRLPPGKVL